MSQTQVGDKHKHHNKNFQISHNYLESKKICFQSIALKREKSEERFTGTPAVEPSEGAHP
jgi:hypothetical protein